MPPVARLSSGEEIVLVMVGHNSTHGFFLGVSSDDKLFKSSLDLSDDAALEDVDNKVTEALRQVTGVTEAGYLGHL